MVFNSESSHPRLPVPLDSRFSSAFRRERADFRRFATRELVVERALVRARRLAELDTPVLLIGEPGAGKSLLAQAIHFESPRAEHPLRVLGPGDVGLSDLRRALFGAGEEASPLEEAQGGSVVLDELQEWPEEVQFLFEHFLDQGSFPAAIGPRTLAPNIRLIATVSAWAGAQAQVPTGLSLGLYQRLRAGQLEVPPLAARTRDLAHLAEHFLQRFASRQGQQPARLGRAALESVEARRWYGNLRELDQAMRAASMAVGSGGEIRPEDLPPPMEPALPETHLPYRMAELERWAYARALRVASGNRRQAIELLGVSPATFYRKARRFGLLDEASAPVPR